MSKDTGGPAFPTQKRIYKAGYPTSEFEPEPGAVTLLDYFAAKVLQGMWANPNVTADYLRNTAAKDAYLQAAAMLEARK